MMIIRNINLGDINSVAELEKRIEKENAATKEILLSRFNIFPQGFYITEENGCVIGYVESCLWNKTNFETFKEIKDFPKHHDPNGKILKNIICNLSWSGQKL